MTNNLHLLYDSLEKNEISLKDRLTLLTSLIQKDPDYNDIYNRLVDYLKMTIPELETITDDSIFSNHLKIISFVFYEFIFQSIRELEKNIFIETANEEYLLRYAKEFGLSRKSSYQLVADICVGSQTKPLQLYSLPQGSLIHIPKTNQFLSTLKEIIISPDTIQDIKGYYTVKVPVSSFQYVEANNNNDFTIQYDGFTIAHTLNIAENFQKVESLEDFRSRLLNTSQGLPPYSELAIQSKIENLSFVRHAYIDRKADPGIITSWIEFYPHQDLENKVREVHKNIDSQLHLVSLRIHPVQYQKISLSFYISSFGDLNREQFYLEFKKQVTYFFEHYDVIKYPTLNLKVLFQFAYQNPYIQEIQFLNLTTSILENSFRIRYVLNEFNIEWKE